MKKICLLFLVLTLLVFLLLVNPLKISAIFEYNLDEQAEEERETTENCSTRSIPGGEDTHGEEWYNLSDDNPILTNTADYSSMPEMLQYLKPGDIIYETNGSPIGDLTKHIAIVYDTVWSAEYNQYYVAIIEAYLGGVGFGIMTPNRLEEKDVIIYRLTNASSTQIQGALEFIEGQLGKPYRFHFGKSDDYDSADWYCSELVWAAFNNQGIPLDWDDNENGGSAILPAALASYENLTTILHYDQETTLTSVDDTYHTYSCDGDTYTEIHDYIDINSCYEKCRACDHIHLKQAHDYTNEYKKMSSATHHYAYCECGERTTERHNFYTLLDEKICFDCNYRISTNHTHLYTYTPMGLNSHRKTCSCGDKVIETCIGRAMIGGTSYCMYCGQELNSEPGLLSVGDDDAILPNNKEDEEHQE